MSSALRPGFAGNSRCQRSDEIASFAPALGCLSQIALRRLRTPVRQSPGAVYSRTAVKLPRKGGWVFRERGVQ